MDENKIKQFMKSLDLTREEAIELIKEDEQVDKMTVKETENDLTPDQKKAIKKIKGGAKAVDAYGKKRTVQRKPDDDKRLLISLLHQALKNTCENIEITNPQGQINFLMNGRKFRIVLSAPREGKKGQ